MYKNYIFDLYGTLIDINTDEEKEQLWEEISKIYSLDGANYSAQELREEYIKLVEEEKSRVLNQNANIEYVDIKLDNVFEKLYINKGVKVSKDKVYETAHLFRTKSTKYLKLYDGAMELLDDLKENGKNIYLLTNAQRCFTVPELEKLGILDKFDGIVISSDEEVCKPDKLFYNTIFKRYDLNIEDSIMIGNDYITDIEGSYNIGLDNLYVHTNLSPEIKGELKAKYKVMDADIFKISKLIL